MVSIAVVIEINSLYPKLHLLPLQIADDISSLPDWVKLLFKLGYIENYASDLSRIFNEYRNYHFKLIMESSLVALKWVLPNRNYNAFSEDEKNKPLNDKQKQLLEIIRAHPYLNKK